MLCGCILKLLNHFLHILCIFCDPLAFLMPLRMLLLDKLLNELVSFL